MTNQNPQFTNPYFANALFYHQFDPTLVNFDMAELQAFQMFTASDIFAPSIATMTPDGSFMTPIKNVQQVSGVIATVTTNGNGLDLTFTDPTLATFRLNQKVNDNLMNEAYVTAVSPGKVTIMPFINASGVSLNAVTSGSQFKVNTTMTAVGKVAATMNSVGTISLYDNKDTQTDWTEITRESLQVARMEKMNWLAGTTPTGEEAFYSYTENELDTFNRMLWEISYKYMFGKGSGGLQLSDGVGAKTMSIRNRIIQDSSNYQQSTSAPISQSVFEAMVLTCAGSNPNYGDNIHIMPGIRALQQLGTFYPTQMGFAAGQRNGETMSVSLDTREVFIAGIKVKVLLNFALLNSAKIPDWHKDSVYMLNMAPAMYTNIDGTQSKKGKMVQLIHSSPDAASTSSFIRNVLPGTTGSGLGNNTGLGAQGQNMITTSPVDGYGIEFLDHSGIAMVGKGHGLYEFQHP